jgi:hypothetical protein
MIAPGFTEGWRDHWPFTPPPSIGERPPLGYVVWAEKWPQPGGVGTPVNLTYAWQAYTSDLNQELQIEIFERALWHWANVAPLFFTEVVDSGLPVNDINADPPDLRFGFFTGDHGPCSDFDGGGGVLGHAYPPPQEVNNWTIWGDMHLDDAETWSDGSGAGVYDMEEVATHELGHALGMRHSDNPPALMEATYKGSGWTGSLYTDDINGIQSLYGSGQGDVNPLSNSAPVCWQATAEMPNGDVWRDSGSGQCPLVLRVPLHAKNLVVTDNGKLVHPRIIKSS